MSYRLTYSVDADGSARLELECESPAFQSVAERAFLCALDRLPKVGTPIRSDDVILGDGVPIYDSPRLVECDDRPGVHLLGSHGSCLNPSAVRD